MIPGAPAISNMVPATKQMRTLMYGSSGRNFTQSRPRSRVMNPNPARISAVIINARVTTSFRGCSASIESYSSQVRIPSKAFVTHSHHRPRHFVLTSRESSAFTIQQSVQVATTKNPVEKKAKKQAVYWRRPLMLASSLSGRDTWAAVSPGPPQVAGTLSVFWAAGTSISFLLLYSFFSSYPDFLSNPYSLSSPGILRCYSLSGVFFVSLPRILSFGTLSEVL